MSQIGQYTTTGVTEVKTLTADTGGPVGATVANINVYGGNNIGTDGFPITSTIHINLTGTTDHSVQIGNLSGSLTSLAVATNGQILLGTTGADPVFGNLGVSNGIAKVEGAGSLSIAGIQATTAQIGVVTLASDAEAIAGTDASKVIVPTSLKAKLGAQTLHGLPIGAADTAAITWTAEPTDGQILIGKTGNSPVLGSPTNGNNISWTGGAGTLTANVTGTTQHSIQIGNVSGSLSSLALGATGEVLMGTTANDPSWTNSPTFGGSITAAGTITSSAGDIIAVFGSVWAGNTANDATSASSGFRKSRGILPLVVIQSGDGLGNLRYTGYDGANYISGAKITSTNSGTVAANRIAGDLKFCTHPDAVIALPSEPLTRMTIASTGEVTIATPDSGTGLTVSGGGITATTGNITASTGIVTGVTLRTGDPAALAAISSITAKTLTMDGTDANIGFTITPKGSAVGLTVSAGGITATVGNITASSGSVSASTTVTAGTNLVSTAGNLLLPTTSATVGQIQINSSPVFHTYGAGGQNIFIGGAGNFTMSATAASCIGIGAGALTSINSSGANNGFNNICIGVLAGNKLVGTTLTEGRSNVVVGSALSNATSSSYCVSIGSTSLGTATSGDYNVALGAAAGNGASPTTGSYNSFLGSYTGTSYNAAESSNIIIGYGINGTAGESNKLRIGNGTGSSAGRLDAAYISGIYTTTATASANKKVVMVDDANLVYGTTSPTVTTLYTGGLSFDSGATTMSHYSTDTWTPTINFAGGSTGITYSTQTGTYYRIGSIIFFYFNVVLTSKGSSTGQLRIAGLPVTPASGSTFGVLFRGIRPSSSAAATTVILGFVSNSNYFYITFADSNDSAIGSLDDANCSNDSAVRGSGFYFV